MHLAGKLFYTRKEKIQSNSKDRTWQLPKVPASISPSRLPLSGWKGLKHFLRSRSQNRIISRNKFKRIDFSVLLTSSSERDEKHYPVADTAHIWYGYSLCIMTLSIYILVEVRRGVNQVISKQRFS